MRPEAPTILRPLSPLIGTPAELARALSYNGETLLQLIETAPELYSSFQIPKPTGGYRTIRPPAKELRELQRTILDVLQKRVRYPHWMTGGVPKRSIFDHAKPHVGRHMVATFDIESFFPSTNNSMVRRVLNQIGFRDVALENVVRLVTKDGQLPQGGPASLFLANLSMDVVDRRIHTLCRKHSLSYTRYVDDIALSGEVDLFAFRGAIMDWVSESGYSVAPEKARFMSNSESQIITKLRVNTFVRPTKLFIAEVKESIWECLNVGPAMTAIAQGITVSRLKKRLTGRVSYITQSDATVGKKLRGMLCGVNWTNHQFLPSATLASSADAVP